MEFFEPPPSDNMDESYPPNPFDTPFDLPNMGTRALSTLQQPELPSESLDDLFGDDQDEPMAAIPQQQEDEEEELDEEEARRRRRLEYEEDEDPETVTTTNESIAGIALANYAIPPSGKVWHARLPNFLQLSSKPFAEETWKAEQFEVERQRELEESERKEDDGEKKEKAIIPDENVIRWRWGTDDYGEPIKESNSRIVQWSDGSLSLQIGTELFDITAAIDHSATLPTNTTGYVAPKEVKSGLNALATTGPELSTFNSERSHGLTYLTAQHEYADLSEAQASVHGTMTFRPTTLQSKTHRLLAANIAGRNAKIKAMKQTLTEKDPERQKAALEKAEIDNAKKAARAASKASGGGSKKRIKKDTRFYGGSDDEGSEEEGSDGSDGFGNSQRRSNPRRGRNGPLAQDSENEFEEDDFVVGSDDDGNAPENARARNKRNNGREEEDDIEDLDSMLDREAAKKAETRRRGGADPDEPVQKPSRRLVIESDEDE